MNGMHFYDFGPYRLDPNARLLHRDGIILSLPPKAVDTLLVLVESRGTLIGKEQLLERVWPGTFVEENNLAQSVSLLRKALGSQANGQPYIETIPRRGYRFSGEVTEVPVQTASPLVASPTQTIEPLPQRHSWRRLAVAWTAVTVATMVAATVGVGAWLRSSGSGRMAGQTPSVAVLPFANFSADAASDYLSDGFTDELIQALGGVDGLKVVGRSSSFQFKGKAYDLRTIGKSLSVGWILEGSVRQDGNRLRITVQLADSRTGFQIWSRRYERESQDAFAIQEEICQGVVRAVSGQGNERF
jgi:TolB-like protein/DNA-binding winged helix-turn-helix (wHTH) protein